MRFVVAAVSCCGGGGHGGVCQVEGCRAMMIAERYFSKTISDLWRKSPNSEFYDHAVSIGPKFPPANTLKLHLEKTCILSEHNSALPSGMGLGSRV